MPAFLAKFFPDVYHHTQNPGHGDSAYCKYNNQGLQLFTSCLFIAAAFSSLVGGYTTRWVANDFATHILLELKRHAGRASALEA